MTAYKITFADGKLGRGEQPPLEPFVVEVPINGREDGLVREILRRATPRLMSSDVDVYLDADGKSGGVAVGGFRVVGTFAVEAVMPE